MEQALPCLIVPALIGLVFWAIIRENNRRRQRTPQEYEKELADTRSSLLRAGMIELDKFVGDTRSKRAAVEYLKDEEQGTTKTGGKDDDRDRTGSVQ
jgi:hypothetical protein